MVLFGEWGMDVQSTYTDITGFLVETQ
jgi:hypothetical protein